MSLMDWDSELASMSSKLQHLLATERDGRKAQRRGLVFNRVGIVQAQAKLDHVLDGLKNLTQRDLLLLPREKAVLHWGRIYTERAASHWQLLGRVLTKNLWLKLVTLRSGELLDGDQLVGLSVRKANLSKTERYLRSAIDTVKQQQRELAKAYHQLGVEMSNREAACCMTGRLGLDAKDVAASPALRALTSYFMHLTAGVRGDAATQRFLTLHQTYENKALTLMNQCRTSILNNGDDPAQALNSKTSDKFEAAMRQLDELEAGVKVAYQAVVLDQAPKARPRIITEAAGASHAANSGARPL